MAFGYYTPYAIDHTLVGGSDQANFPVYLGINDARFKSVGNGGHVQSASGYDLRPHNDATLLTPLSFELVPGTYNATTGVAEMHAKQYVSAISDSMIYLGYGDSSITTDGTSTATWNANFAAVLHLGTPSSLNATDSTSQANSASTINAATATTGKIGGGASFNGSSAYIEGFSTAPPTSGAIGCLFKSTGNGSGGVDGYIVSHFNTPHGGDRIYLYIDHTTGRLNARLGSNSATQISLTDYRDSAWHRAVLVYGTAAQVTQSKIYVDGNAAVNVTNATATLVTASAEFALGANSFGGGSSHQAYFGGAIDEFYVYSTPPTPDWITAEYTNQNSPATFAVMGTEVVFVTPRYPKPLMLNRAVMRAALY